MAAGATPTAAYGGFEYEFVETLPDRVLCKICRYPSRDPYMSLCCGHAFCKSCLERQRQASSIIAYACSVCRKEEPEFKTVPYVAIDREVKELHVYCTNKRRGCEWKGEINNISNHCNNCQFGEVKCFDGCGWMVQKRYLTNHVETECPRRKVNCQYCHDRGEHQFIEGQHKEECPKLPLPCPNNCEVGTVPREDMEAHRKECSLEKIQCEYHNVGCEVRMARKDYPKHMKDNVEEHLMMTQTRLTNMQQLLQTTFDTKLQRTKNDFSADLHVVKNQLMSTTATKNELTATNEQLIAVKNVAHQTMDKLDTIKKELSVELSTTKELSAMKKELATVNNELSRTLTDTRNQLSQTNNIMASMKDELLATINALSDKLLATTNELSVMKRELETTKAELFETKRELAAVKGTCQDVDKIQRVTRSFHQKFEITEQSLDTLQAKFFSEIAILQENQKKAQVDQWMLRLHTLSISGDKTCPVTVRVSEVTDKKRRKTKWHSHPFYTHDKGYKVCLRVLIDGAGRGEGTHVSVFLYLMKGPYDNNLQWPLIGNFEVALLNQKMDGEHYTNGQIKFTDRTPLYISSRVSVKQPDDIAHDGLGRNEFILYEGLYLESPTCQFLKDDCIFIRVRKPT